MRIVIEKAHCVGNARCHAVAGHLFALDDDGYVATAGFEVPAGEEDWARKGARACPERIIMVSEG